MEGLEGNALRQSRGLKADREQKQRTRAGDQKEEESSSTFVGSVFEEKQDSPAGQGAVEEVLQACTVGTP